MICKNNNVIMITPVLCRAFNIHVLQLKLELNNLCLFRVSYPLECTSSFLFAYCIYYNYSGKRGSNINTSNTCHHFDILILTCIKSWM